VKFHVRVSLLRGQVFSPFGEDWLAVGNVGGGVTSRVNVPMKWFLDE